MGIVSFHPVDRRTIAGGRRIQGGRSARPFSRLILFAVLCATILKPDLVSEPDFQKVTNELSFIIV